MSIHVIDADFGSYEPRRNRPIRIGRDETLGLSVRWRDGSVAVDITGAYASAWLVDADGDEHQLPARIVDATGGVVHILQPPFALAAGDYTLITRLTLGDVTRRARVDLTLERAIGSLIAPPIVVGTIENVSLVGGGTEGAVDAAAAIVGATEWAVTGASASIDDAGLVTLATDVPLVDEMITVTGSNDVAGVMVSFRLSVEAVWIVSGGTILMAPVPPAAPIVSGNQITG